MSAVMLRWRLSKDSVVSAGHASGLEHRGDEHQGERRHAHRGADEDIVVVVCAVADECERARGHEQADEPGRDHQAFRHDRLVA